MARPTRDPKDTSDARDNERSALERQVSELQREVTSLKREREAAQDGWFQPAVMAVLFLGLFGAFWFKYAAPIRRAPAAVEADAASSGDYNPPPGAAPAPQPAPAAPTVPPGPPVAAAPADGAVPPSMEIPNALRAVYPVALECAHGAHGINVSLSFDATGAVGEVSIRGTDDAAVRQCITNAVRAAPHIHPQEGPPRPATFAL